MVTAQVFDPKQVISSRPGGPMPKVEIYTRAWCGYCHMARSLLQSLGCQFTEYDVEANAGLQQEMFQRTGGQTVPQVLIDNRPVGGFMELARLQHSGALARMLADAATDPGSAG